MGEQDGGGESATSGASVQEGAVRVSIGEGGEELALPLVEGTEGERAIDVSTLR